VAAELCEAWADSGMASAAVTAVRREMFFAEDEGRVDRLSACRAG